MKKQLAALVMFTGFSAGTFAGPFDTLQREENAAHTPVITAPATVQAGEPFDVTIAIGDKVLHPSDIDHFIRYIALYAGEVEIARAFLTPTMAVPQVTFSVTLSQPTTLRALSAPNHSAAWVTEHKIDVRGE